MPAHGTKAEEQNGEPLAGIRRNGPFKNDMRDGSQQATMPQTPITMSLGMAEKRRTAHAAAAT
jgi:hypothetical protein